MTTISPFPCYLVRKDDDGHISAGIESITVDDLPAGEVLIEVAFSSLNYKDALACQGHRGVVRKFPHVPGIDCAGKVVESTSPDYQPGDEVLVTGYELGSGSWGGYSAYGRVPASWVVPLPKSLSLREAMVYGTAGFTAAQAVTAIVERGISPEKGEVVVTGSTGGVGSISIAILAKLGYQVVAVTGKTEQHDWLTRLGAARILGREDVLDETDRPLLSERWAAAVDTVGGAPLATILRAMGHRGCVAACGMVAGQDLPLTVYPFILRGVSLAGIDSAQCDRASRLQIWEKLAGAWRVDRLEQLGQTINLRELPESVTKILAGEIVGRTVVEPS